MGVVYSTIVRKVRRFNVENRAMRQIAKEKPVVAPRHPSSAVFYNDYIKATPEVKDTLINKDADLDSYLKKVYVQSSYTNPEIKRDRSLLPQNRMPVEDDELGFYEPPEIPQGYCNLRQVLKFLADHQGDPKLWSAAAIAKEYKIDENQVGNILEYYKTFNIYIPTVREDLKGMYSARRIARDVKELFPPPNDEESPSKKDKDDSKDKT